MPPFISTNGVSSDEIETYLSSLSKRNPPQNMPISQLRSRALSSSSSSPLELANTLTARENDKVKPVEPSRGIVDPHNINMQGLMALFALIGAAFVLAAIWFFFWAKNGGFVWRKGDWEEYKSTVLRRKDSNGRTLTNASKSTDLGGGSIVGRGYSDYQSSGDATTNVDGSTVSGEKPRRKGLRETAKQKLLRKRREEQWEGGGDDDVRAYRHEKPARVGGLNREADGEYSTDYTTSHGHDSEWSHSQTQTNSHVGPPPSEYDPPPERHNSQRQRNVSGFSFTAGEDETISNVTEEHRLRDQEATANHSRRRDHRSRTSASARPRGPRPSSTANRSRQSSPRKRDRAMMPGSYAAPLDMSSANSGSEYMYDYERVGGVESDAGTGTRSYHHPIPGLSKGYRRADGGGGRGRGRRDSLSESEGEEWDSRVS
ncbi:hypothetical protein AJ79_07108 [Helicocarpus griseus UAMH5409]|uniref:Uncharacterized protein n=1 Tax=Helicocarpus griseus UAMH5409 TaxID=1447875 RepID=A0A2B7X6N8_9EURO|nr:hypothetical protein AJ79_07108 [Helicocarpus griseus UAMH5409]